MRSYLEGRVKIETGDITTVKVDAVVNAANSGLLGGGGVDGAIHRAGGPEILAECRKIRETVYPEGLPTGKAVATTGGRLPARLVIHTVGPVWHGGKNREDALLEDAYRNSLLLAEEKGLKSVAFPAISTGVYGFPKERAAALAAGVLRDYFMRAPGIEEVRLVFFSAADAEIFSAAAGPIFEGH